MADMKRKKRILSAEPANLKRFRYGVKDLAQQSQRDITGMARKSSQMSRKEKRMEGRKLKKMRKLAYSQRKKVPTAESIAKEKKLQVDAEKAKKKRERSKTRRKQMKKRFKQRKIEEEEQKRADLAAANKYDDRVIKQMEKQLGLKKRKSKTLPASFVNDGLADLLDVVDSEKVKDMLEQGDKDSETGDIDFLKDLEGSSDESEEDRMEENLSDEEESYDEKDDADLEIEVPESQENVKGILKKLDTQTKDTKNVNFDSGKFEHKEIEADPDTDESKEDSDESGDDEEDDDGDSVTSVTSMNSDISENEAKEDIENKGEVETEAENKYEEDIYGRLRDESGNVVDDSSKSGSYVPPSKRLAMAKSTDEKKKIELERMNKKLKGLINRLSEANLQGIGSQIEDMYRHQSRAYLSEALTGIILDACVAPTLVPERLVMEHAMLIAILHNNIGSEVGALFLQELVNRYNQLYTSGHPYGGDKRIDNILVILSHLYNFKVIQCVLVYDIMKQFVGSFLEKDIELLLLLLKNVGFDLRKDDASTLKEMIVDIQKKASQVNCAKFSDPSRVKFMLEILMAIRNNNMRKIPNYDPTHLDHLKKLLRNFIKGGSTSDNQLRINLSDLLNTEKLGRWWLVGSAWSGRDGVQSTDKNDNSSSSEVLSGISDEILELARKQRMNTDVRKNIFCIVMTAEDFVDAFEKLLRLGLKHQQEREIIHVIMDLSAQEKRYNPFYSYVIQKFCEYHRRFQMTVQFTVWDRLKILKDHTEAQLNNLAALLTHLLATNAASLSIFKVVEFSELDRGKLKLMKKVLHKLLSDYPDYVITDVFTRIAPFPKLKMLRDGLKLFMNHFLLKDKTKETKDESTLQAFKDNIKLAESCMGSSDVDYLL